MHSVVQVWNLVKVECMSHCIPLSFGVPNTLLSDKIYHIPMSDYNFHSKATIYYSIQNYARHNIIQVNKFGMFKHEVLVDSS